MCNLLKRVLCASAIFMAVLSMHTVEYFNKVEERVLVHLTKFYRFTWVEKCKSNSFARESSAIILTVLHD